MSKKVENELSLNGKISASNTIQNFKLARMFIDILKFQLQYFSSSIQNAIFTVNLCRKQDGKKQ